MLCILKIEHNDVTGWIVASDIHDARRKAQDAMLQDLAAELYRMEFAPKGKTRLLGKYILLAT